LSKWQEQLAFCYEFLRQSKTGHNKYNRLVQDGDWIVVIKMIDVLKVEIEKMAK
jgi:hypothetical protein